MTKNEIYVKLVDEIDRLKRKLMRDVDRAYIAGCIAGFVSLHLVYHFTNIGCDPL